MGKIGLQPLPGYALVRLSKKYESGLSVEKEKYATNSRGELVKFIYNYNVTDENANHAKQLIKFYGDYVGHTVYFTPFEDGDVVKHDGAEYVFVPIEQLRGGKK